MIIQFSVKNFKTFKYEVKLSLIASGYDKMREDENVFSDEKFNLRLLKSAVVYGANASGKSKLIEAMNFMKKFVVSGANNSLDKEEIPVDPFRLNDESESLPSVFEIIFVHYDTLYRYGFEVNKKQVISEWLYYRPKTKETELFYRDGQQFETHKTRFTKGNLVVKENLVRSNVLLLSAAAQWNDKISNEVVDWFKNLKILSGVADLDYKVFTAGRTGEEKHKAQILELIKAADLGIQDVSLKMLDINALPSDMPKELKERIVKKVKEESAEFLWDVLMSHKIYNSARQAVGNVSFSLDDDESLGTQKFFSLSGPILHVLENGYTLFVDELGSQLHPNLVSKLVSLFNSKKHNPKNAQLIFNTHDTNLLGENIFRRDQIWFTEKNKYGESKLYSLADFKSDIVRNNEAFEDNYIRGKYGAIPYLDYFNYLLNHKSADSHEAK